MSVSIHVIGIKPPDEAWKKMKAVYDACVVAGIDAPNEVIKFFDGEDPDEKGVTIDLTPYGTSRVSLPGVEPWEANGAHGFEVELSKLDPTVKILRFYAAW